MKYSILHITDLHINDVTSTSEHLREKFYREYIDSLVTRIKGANLNPQTLIITGDFIDRAKIENFTHVKKVIDYLIQELSINQENVCLCIGNHDYAWKKEKDDYSNSQELRKYYHEFANTFNGEEVFRNERAVVKKINDDIYYLSLDATLGSNKGKPGDINNEEVDSIVSDALRPVVNENKVLLIGCHFPLENFPGNLLYQEESGWHENHFWSQAALLRERINKLKGISHSLWFFGDTHFPQHLQDKKAYYIMTGRFGGDSSNTTTAPRQCKIITSDFKNDSEVQISTFNCKIGLHHDSAMTAEWEESKGEFRGEKKSIEIEVEESNSISEESDVQEMLATELISEALEEELITKIRQKNLYSFGRFATSENVSSLGWISINELLSDHTLLSSIVEKTVNTLHEQINNSVDEIAIIGLDFWGSIIGSQISIGTGINHYCLATRGKGQFHTDFEIDNRLLKRKVTSVKDIIIVTDVVSSGSTIDAVINLIDNLNPNINYSLFTVISNEREFTTYNPKLVFKGSFCQKIQIPILPNDALPDKGILPPNIDFSISSD